MEIRRKPRYFYQHKRVVFGITNSPFLLGATLEHHLKQVSGHLQLTAQNLAKFNLRGWEHTGVSEAEKGTLLEEEKKVPVLGLIWKPEKDTLSVKWEGNSKINDIPTTKRKILSAVHRIFDPIVFTCPVTLEPKILLQEYEAVETKDQEKDEETSEEKDKDKEKEKEKEVEKEEKDDQKEVKKPKPKEPKYVGHLFVVSVQGYYCKLCPKFFKEVSVEKSKHFVDL
ncbi:uncharacterized protein TNCV_2050421 [Trichonephila clavipes]|nr:uncharacterized protein TNCV_2050421 [Trichonephila clavipes]